VTTSRVRILLLAALVPLGTRAVGAQTLTASGNPGLLRISTAVAGSQPVAVTNATTTYTVVTPAPNRTYKITAQLNANMPTGTTLTATFAQVPQSISAGAIPLDVTPRNVVTSINKNTNNTASITYSFTATTAAGVIPSTSRTVTLTVSQEP
jgi:hypothetical protein